MKFRPLPTCSYKELISDKTFEYANTRQTIRGLTRHVFVLIHIANYLCICSYLYIYKYLFQGLF